MGTFSKSTNSLKQTLLQFFNRYSRKEQSLPQTAAEICPEDSLNSPSFVYPTNQLCELPSGDTMATLSSYPTELVSNEPVAIKDRWLGFKILDVAVANVTLRSISPHASEKDFEDLCKDMMNNFRYEECYKALCGPSEPQQSEASFHDLLLGQIGHIYRRDPNRGSMELSFDLEKYVDDPRRHQNEKYMIPEESNLNHKSEAGTLSHPPLKSLPSTIQDSNSNRSLVSPTSPLHTDIRTPPGTADGNEPALAGYTSRLQEHGNKKGLRPTYTFDTTQYDPEWFVSTVRFGKLEARGTECLSKKAAKHEASKALWLGFVEPCS